MPASAKISDQSTVHSAPRFGAPQPEEIAAHFPQLEIIEVIGQGGMGVVYKARQKSLDRIVALKLLLPNAHRLPNDDCAFAERFTREACALARLQHPNIVTVHDSGLAGPYYFFIMEHVDGANLRRMLATKSIRPEDAVAIVPPICDALDYAHQEGIAHRDIKPENILIDRKGRVKIADFGIAKLLQRGASEHTLTATHQTIGTLHYMAPEQIEKPSTVDHRADIYSVGVVFYEMLTGELPIGRFDLPSQKCGATAGGRGLDRRLDNVVMRSLEKEPARRYQRISEVKSELHMISTSWHAAAISGSGAKSIGIAYLLWCLAFLGLFGIHRFYAGKWVTGIIWLLTAGLLFIGQFIDLFLIPDMVRLSNMRHALSRLQQPPQKRPEGGTTFH